MAALKGLHTDPTLAAADAAIEAKEAQQPLRPYLGISGLGHECERKVWFDFRWGSAPQWSAATLKRFQDGHRTEDLIAERLRAVDGVELHTTDPHTGKQFEVWDPDCPHIRGHMDGCVRGLLQAPNTWHVFEVKCCGSSQYSKVKKLLDDSIDGKDVLKRWSAIYYAQAQLYMYLSGMDRHYCVVASAGGREWLSFRTELRRKEAKELLARARRIALDLAVPREASRISDSPAYWTCKHCTQQQLCHGQSVAMPTCRSCCHATALKDGEWQCEVGEKPVPLNVEQQRAGCDRHHFLPGMLPDHADKGPDGHYTSGELYEAGQSGTLSQLYSDPVIDRIRSDFGARLGQWRLPERIEASEKLAPEGSITYNEPFSREAPDTTKHGTQELPDREHRGS